MSEESLNSNEDLDPICCECAGILPDGYIDPREPCTVYSRASVPNGITVLKYPPVSTDGGACWRLIDALSTRGDRPNSRKRSVAIDMGVDAHGFGFGVRTGAEIFHGNHKSGPMALALAVAQLAKSEATA